MNPVTVIFIVLITAGVVIWVSRLQRSGRRDPAGSDIDHDTLAEAEEEVRDLGTFTSPDDADDELPDWGPGAPK